MIIKDILFISILTINISAFSNELEKKDTNTLEVKKEKSEKVKEDNKRESIYDKVKIVSGEIQTSENSDGDLNNAIIEAQKQNNKDIPK